MNIERTFAIIKPDAVQACNSGLIIHIIELNGFNIVNLRKKQLSKIETELFYEVYKDKPFFNDLVKYMTSGPVILLELEKENAINLWRELIGTTEPKNAAIGTIRKMFGQSIEANAVHGSDSLESAKREIGMFFK